MLGDKIQQYFNRYPELRILFLFDATKDYRTDFDEIDLPDYRKLVYHNNDFELKVRLNNDWLNEKVVLYLAMAQPITKEEMHAFPLLDLLFANKSIQPDDSIGDFMEEYQLQRHQRTLAEKYLNDLKLKLVQETMKPFLDAVNFTEENIIHGILAAALKFPQPENWELIFMRWLTYTKRSNEIDWYRLIKKVNDYKLEEFILNKIKKITGISLQAWSQQYAKELLDRIKYNLYVQNISEPDKYDTYQVYWSKSTTITGSINLLHEKLLSNSRYNAEWIDLINNNYSGIHEKKILELYGPEANYHYYSDTLKWEIIAELFQSKKSCTAILSVVEKLMASSNTPLFENVLQFMHYSCRSINAIAAIATYILDKPEQYIAHYTGEFYKIDQYYRKAIWYYRFKIDFADVAVQINWDNQLDGLNDQYRIFLEKLNREWLKCWSAKNFDITTLCATPLYNFFQKEIKPVEQKVAVIISDALRFEVGLELMEALNADAKNVAKSRFMLASVPSKTSVGMSNLLPGKEFVFDTDNITIDGISTSGVEKRSLILKNTEPDSHAIKLSELEGKTQKEKREIFKAKVVYIYHDVIDSTGDKASSQRDTFLAVDQTISQLTRFIKLLHGSYNVAKVLVTADHGFLYNDYTIEEGDKEKGSGLVPLIPHSRYEIVAQNMAPALGYIFPLKNTTKFSDDLFVVIPGSVNRYSRAGAGNQYVHGGASLQELVVPIIESARKLEEVSGLVTPSLVTKDLKVVSNVLKFILVQEEPVSASHKERTLVIGLYKDNDLISNEKQLDLNKTSDSPTERIFQVDLHVIQLTRMETMYKLKISDKNDRLNAIIEADVKNQTLIQKDF